MRSVALLAMLAAVQPVGAPALGTPDAALTRLFTPMSPVIPAGTYAVYRSPLALPELAAALRALDPHPAAGAWQVQRPEPLEAFEPYGTHDRSKLARLFNGRRVSLARGSLLLDGQRVAFVLTAPYPDETLTAVVERGTMVIVFRVPAPPSAAGR